MTNEYITQLPETDLNEKITKLILWRCYNRTHEIIEDDGLDALLNEVRSVNGSDALYEKIGKKMQSGQHGEFMSNSWKVKNEREKSKKEQEMKELAIEKEKLYSFIKSELKTYETYSTAMYKTKSGRGINKDFISFVIDGIKYNSLGDIQSIGCFIVENGIFKKPKENFIILELKESSKLFGKTIFNKRTLILQIAA